MSHRAKTFLAAAALVALGAAAWFNSLRGAFIFDDTDVLLRNGALRSLWPPGPILSGPRPFVDLTFGVNYALGGLRPAGYHAVNVAIHLLAALTLFGIVRRTMETRRQTMDDGRSGAALPSIVHRPSSSVPVAFAAALLWMLHPLQTESVTYITQRMESLMGLFYFLTLYCFIRATSSPRAWAWSAAAVAACALGMASKQVMVTAPVAVLLYDWTFVAGLPAGGVGSLREALRKRGWLYLALAATCILLARSVLSAFSPHPASAGFAVPGLTSLAYARSELGVILHYLRLAFWPGGLCLDYGWPVARTAGEIVPGAIVVGGLAVATIWAILRRSPWGFLGGWFFLTLAPTSSFLPIKDLAVEHRMYLPLAALAAAAVLAARQFGRRLLARLGDSAPARKTALCAAAALLLCAAGALAWRTRLRNADYASPITIWQDAARQNPGHPRFQIWNYLGAALVEAGKPEESLPCFEKALDKNPRYADAWNNRAVAWLRMGRWDLALRDSNEAVRLKPDDAQNYYNRGKAFAALNRGAEAVGDYTQAIRLSPYYAEGWYSRGNAYGKIGRFDDAILNLSRAIELQHDYVNAYNDRAVAWYYLKDYDKALADVRAAQKHGGSPDAAFLKALAQAAEQRKKAEP